MNHHLGVFRVRSGEAIKLPRLRGQGYDKWCCWDWDYLAPAWQKHRQESFRDGQQVPVGMCKVSVEGNPLPFDVCSISLSH